MRTCQKILVVAAAMLAARAWGGTGATQTWVANYVSNYVASTRAEVSSRVEKSTTTNGWLRLEVDGVVIVTPPSTERAILCVEDTARSAAYGITNNMVFAEDPGAGWRNGSLLIRADATNMWFEADGARFDYVQRGRYGWLSNPMQGDLCAFSAVRISEEYVRILLTTGD